MVIAENLRHHQPFLGADLTPGSTMVLTPPQQSTLAGSCPADSACPRGNFKNLFSAGLPRNTSLVFDIELEDGGVGSSWTGEDDSHSLYLEEVPELQRFVQPSTSAEARLISDVRIALSSCCDGKDLPALAQALAVQGYHVQLRTALGGGDGADCLRNLRHAFITVTLPNLPSTASMTRIGSSLNLRSCEQQQPTQQQQSSRGASRRFIIDPQFKEQFVIAKATARYCSIIAAVPTVLVAPEDHLPLLVHFLCTEMSLAFRQLGAVLPPWRQASSLLTKWKPRKSTSSEEGLVLPRSAYDQQQQQHEPLNFGLGSAHMGDSVALSLCHMLHPQQPPFGSLVFGGGGIAGAAGMGMSMDRSASTKSSFEPLRVYLGGNFNPINPQPTTALA